MASGTTRSPTKSSPRLKSRKVSYTAPALEKGLDILELLAASERAMTSGQIADQLGRSKNEIFRMVVVLESRGYLARDPASDMLRLSNLIFDMGLRTPQPRRLLDVAYPAMQKLSDSLGHATHLVVISRGETVVIASAADRADVVFTLRLGYRRPAVDATSGQAIIAFQTADVRKQMVKESRGHAGSTISEFKLVKRLEQIRRDGFSVSESRDVVGVVDICAPILDRQQNAVAAIVMPCLKRHGIAENYETVAFALQASCRAISEDLS
jgi:DNA-binding IclR family transcriptional regulator